LAISQSGNIGSNRIKAYGRERYHVNSMTVIKHFHESDEALHPSDNHYEHQTMENDHESS
jgi:hypothetical protein